VVKLTAFFVLALGFNLTAYCAPIYIYGDDFDLPIPQQPDESLGWMEDAVINIPDHHIISDLDIKVNITHTSVFDLQLFLVSPAETIVCLNRYSINEFFIGADYRNTIFDDEALLSIKDEVSEPPFTGRFRPIESLGIFDGEDAFGLWRLRIYDAQYADRGQLDSYELQITIPEPSTVLMLVAGAVFIKLFPSRRRFKPRSDRTSKS